MRKIILLILTAFILLSDIGISAFAGGQVFPGISSRDHFFPGVGFFFHRRKSSRHFFFHLGHFGHRWGADPWGYYSPPPALVVPYPNTPQESFSGTDPIGAFYVEGYRVLPSGWLRLLIEPVDAKVMIDGFPVMIDQASGTSASIGLPIGQHRIEVRKAVYQPYLSEVEIKQAREIFLRITLHQ